MRTYCVVPAICLAAIATGALAQTPPRENWRHSCFTFKDMNQNGVFDMGDKTYSSLLIEMTRPDGSKAWQRSNLDGFANFNTTLGDPTQDVFQAGRHSVRAIFPEGWHTLSDTATQELDFVEQRNAGGLVVPVIPCKPIGVVPILSISGRIVPGEGENAADYQVTATSQDDETRLSFLVDGNGRFSGIARRGAWLLEVSDADGTVIHARDVVLEHGAVLLSDILPGRTPAPELGAQYSELTFDDFLVADTLTEIPSGYGGLNSLNWIVVHNRFYEGSGYVNQTVSSEYVAYNSSGVPVPIWADRPFDFKGTYVGVAWPRGEEDDVIFRAWRGDELAYEDRLRLTDNGPVFFDANYEDITRLEYSHGNYERVVLDNFRYKF